MMFAWTKSRKFQYLIFFTGIAFSFWMFTTFKLHYDHAQILSKVHKLLSTGEWTHFGNRGTGVGYVPGTFLTAMAAWPMAVWYSPYSSMLVILITQIICLVLFLKPIQQTFGMLAGTMFLLLFWLSPWRVEQSELYNPSYLFLFSGIHFYTAYRLSDKNSFLMSALHVLALGFCAQVHFSFVILGFTSLLLLIFRMVRVNWWGVLTGVLFTLLSLLPYFLSLQTSGSEGIEIQASSGFVPGKNLILVYPVLKAVLYWLRYSSFYFARHIFTDVYFPWISVEGIKDAVSLLFHFLKWPIGLGTLLIATLFQWKFFVQVKNQKPFSRAALRFDLPKKDWVFHYSFYLFTGMLISAGLSPVEFNHWHLILCLPVSAMLVSVGASRWLEIHHKWIKIVPVIFIYFIIYNSFISMGSKMHNHQNNYHNEVLKNYPPGKDLPISK